MPKDKEYQKRYEATREKLKKFAVANDYKAMVDYIIEINDETTAENTPECQSMLDFIERNTVIEDSEYEGQDAVREDLVINLGRELQSRLVQYTAELHESLERTKQKVNSGSIPGTELLTDDDPKLKENISYAVFMGSQKFQKLRNVHAVFGHMTTALDMKNSANYVKDLITKKISPYEKEVRERYTTPDKLTGKPIVSVEDLKKDNSYYNSGTVTITKCKGFYANYNNLDGKHPFDKLPDDIQKISAANNIDELEKLKKGYIAEKEQLEMQENADKDKLAELNTSIARTNKAEARMFMKKDIAIFDKKINVIDNYMDKVSELHAEMKDDIKYILEDYEKRKKNKEEISPEYTAYAKSLKNLDYVFNDADNVNAEVLFKSLEQVQKASNTYASTHKGGLSFKGVKGEGLKRADSSRHINKLLDDKLSDFEKAAQAVPPKEAMNEKYSNLRREAVYEKDVAIQSGMFRVDAINKTDKLIEDTGKALNEEYAQKINPNDSYEQQKAALADYAASTIAFKLNSDFLHTMKNNYGSMHPSDIEKINNQMLSKENLAQDKQKLMEDDKFKSMMSNVKTPEDIAKMKEMCGRNKGAELLNEMNKGANMVEKQNAQAEKMKQAQKELKPKERQNTVLGHN